MLHKDSNRKGEQLTSRIWAHHLHIQLCQLHQRTSRVIAAVRLAVLAHYNDIHDAADRRIWKGLIKDAGLVSKKSK